MSVVFQNIDPHPPLRPASVYPPPLLRGEDTLAGWRRGWGVNILEDARHSSVLYLYRIPFGSNCPVYLSPPWRRRPGQPAPDGWAWRAHARAWEGAWPRPPAAWGWRAPRGPPSPPCWGGRWRGRPRRAGRARGTAPACTHKYRYLVDDHKTFFI